MLSAFLAIILTLILVVGIHEAGHALSAKLFKVKIRRISIGFGKALVTWKDKSGCEWVWALWPLGGYVQLLNSRIEDLAPNNYPLCFDKKPLWQRGIILLSGSLANLLSAFLALSLLYMLGFQQQSPLIKEISPQSIAAQAGLQAEDRFLAVNGQKTQSWQEVGMNLIMALGKAKVPVIVVDSQAQVREINLNLSQWPYQNKEHSLFLALGIKPDLEKLNREAVAGQAFFPALYAALVKILFLLKFFLIMIKQVLIQRIPFAILLGPLGLFETSIYSFLQGLAVFLYFIASFSLAVGLVNLLPFPGLDGGSLVYTLVEKIRGKPVSIAFELLLHRFAYIIFFILLLQLLMNDLQRYFISN